MYHIHTLINFPDDREEIYSSKEPWTYEDVCKEMTGALLEYGNASSIVFTVKGLLQAESLDPSGRIGEAD